MTAKKALLGNLYINKRITQHDLIHLYISENR
jgi:hypothetical protein